MQKQIGINQENIEFRKIIKQEKLIIWNLNSFFVQKKAKIPRQEKRVQLLDSIFPFHFFCFLPFFHCFFSPTKQMAWIMLVSNTPFLEKRDWRRWVCIAWQRWSGADRSCSGKYPYVSPTSPETTPWSRKLTVLICSPLLLTFLSLFLWKALVNSFFLICL